jgi:hypothetical protein
MTTSATNGKVLTAREAAHDWFPANCLFGTTRVHSAVCDRITEMLEARDAQQAAIHEEELREARDLLRRLMAFTEHVSDVLNEMDAVEEDDLEKEGGVLAAVRAFLGASQQTGTPPCRWPHCSFAGTCKDICIANPPAGSGTAETCGTCGGSGSKKIPGDTFTGHGGRCPDCGGSGTTKGGKR